MHGDDATATARGELNRDSSYAQSPTTADCTADARRIRERRAPRATQVRPVAKHAETASASGFTPPYREPNPVRRQFSATHGL